ncbi:MAG: tRNA (adenosine(37)-N6)-dimethylallyltransferase MiaA [Desulfobacterales bacterium]
MDTIGASGPDISSKPPVLVICGPTGIGKTTAAIAAAETFGGEVISADSLQVYRFMDIGTAKPTAEERARAPHHLIDVVDPDDEFDAARFSQAAREIALAMDRRGAVPIVAGGTGLYIKAMLYGLFRAKPPDSLTRQRLRQEAAEVGSEVLHRRLAVIDAQAADRIHPHDTFRIVRALETATATGEPITDHHRRHGFRESFFRVMKIGLEMDRQALYDRIDRRVDAMIDAGLLDEVRGLLSRGYGGDLKSMQSLGYRHMVAFTSGRLTWEEAVRTLKRDTRRFAKRQLTWFRADKEIVWSAPENIRVLFPKIEAFLRNDGCTNP